MEASSSSAQRSMSVGQAILMASAQRAAAARENPMCQASPTGRKPKTRLRSDQNQTSWWRRKSRAKRVQMTGDFMTRQGAKVALWNVAGRRDVSVKWGFGG